jgi:hypothetical protein
MPKDDKKPERPTKTRGNQRAPRRILTENDLHAAHPLRELLSLAFRLGGQVEHRKIGNRDVLQMRFFMDEDGHDDD